MGRTGIATLGWKFVLAAVLPLALSACSGGQENAEADKPLPGVIGEVVTEEEVSNETTFVGQTRSSQSVDIEARVKGTLQKRPFEEGTEVKEGSVLYEIDPAQFEADLLGAKATLAKAEAESKEKNLTLARYQVLVDKNSPGVSEAQYDIALSQARQADAAVESGKADVANAKLNLGYATITSPLNGRAGISTVDVGNIISPESGVLVTVVALDPIEVDFSVGERIYLNYMEAVEAGTAKAFTPQIRLANGKLYPHKGKVYVVNNEVDPATGTIALRLKFPNPEKLLLPGQYVTVVLTDDKPEKHVVIPQAAVQQNQSGAFVLTVDGSDQVQSRSIKTGQRQGIGIVVTEGLQPGETIIVEGIQKVRPGAKVKVTFQDPSGTAANVEGKSASSSTDGTTSDPSSDKSDVKPDENADASSETGDEATTEQASEAPTKSDSTEPTSDDTKSGDASTSDKEPVPPAEPDPSDGDTKDGSKETDSTEAKQ